MTGTLGAAGSLPGADAPLWYLGRATGTVSLLLLTGTLVLGVLVRRGGTVRGLPRFVVAGLHRNLSLLTVALLAVHVTTMVVDPFAPILLADAIVPFGSDYRPLWLGLGAIALDLLLAVLVTSLLRLRIGRSAWRAVHLLTFAAWPVALVHGLGTGTDTRQTWLLVLSAGCVLAVLGSVLWRIGAAVDLGPRRRAGLAALAVAAPVALSAWLATGPLGPGWAARAGTPGDLLAGSDPAGRPTGTATVSGGVEERVGGGQTATMTLSGTLAGGPGGRLRVVFHGRPIGADGISVTSGTVTLDPDAGGEYTGTLGPFDRDQFGATLRGPAGPADTVDLVATVTIDAGAGTFSGSVVVS
ncbi:MAG TPA: ferric reductase-like transmembrane domain-containing protein [Mycobacteriales bacterium]|nr:ferric reductase-like transmembrane domain-containing protein [Mycobacteriales bacterium]